MPFVFTDQFYIMDPFAPPARGETLTPFVLEVIDGNDDDDIGGYEGDTIDGVVVTEVYPGDTITMRTDSGARVTITGTTFYLADGRIVFTPSDGSVLEEADFLRSTYVTTEQDFPVPQFGPPCFVAGTMIDVPGGTARVESLRPGDSILTADGDAMPLVWTGQTMVRGVDKLAPVLFEPGTIGNDKPLLFSPQHRVLIAGWRAELYCGEPEVLVAAVHLVNGTTIRRAPRRAVRYVHLMCAEPVLLRSEGAITESFNPGAPYLNEDAALRAELAALFPDLPGIAAETARPVPHPREARALAALTEV